VDTRSLNAPILCLVTAGASPAGGGLNLDTIREAARAGADLIQVRERHLDDRSLVSLVRAVVDATAGTGARVVVNDRVDVALAARAAGVHLPGDGIAAVDARRLAPEGFLIGRSTHSEEEAIAAERDGGCDYLVFGTVFPSASKPAGHPVAGVEALARTCAAVRLPVLAIGGVSLANAPQIAAAGASGIAAIALFGRHESAMHTIRTVRRMFDTCYPHRG
jgi:thiamine-phosphate pyrophosphorylase